MNLSHVQAQEELHVALQDNDVARVAQLFTDSTLIANDATEALRRTRSIRDLSLVAVLLQHGADVRVFRVHWVPLSDRPKELLRLLVRYGYDFTLEGHRILRRIGLLATSACKDPELSKAMVCHLLDKHGMAINSNNDDFRDFIHDADDRGSPLCSAILNRNLAVLHELLRRGASPTYPDEYPISYAVQEDGFLPALEPLLCAGVDPDTALEHQNIEAAKICIRFGANPTHALAEALEQVGVKVRSVARVVALNESPSDPDYKEILERKRTAERNSRAMAELLRTGISGSLNAEL